MSGSHSTKFHAPGWAGLGLACVQVVVLLARSLVSPRPAYALIQLAQVVAGWWLLGHVAGFVLREWIRHVEAFNIRRVVARSIPCLCAATLGAVSLQTELDNLPASWRTVFGALCGSGVPLTAWVGVRVATGRPVRALALVVLGLGSVPAIYALRPGEYPWAHSFALLSAWVLVTVGWWFAVWPSSIRRALAPLGRHHIYRWSIAVAAGALFVPTPVAVRVFHARDPGALVPRFATATSAAVVARMAPPDIRNPDPTEFDMDPAWFEPRTHEPSRNPSRHAPQIDRPIVLLITVDALRADALVPTPARRSFVGFKRLMKDGVVFTRAYSTASSTTPALASLFLGVYYSQIRWEKIALGNKRKYFTHRDLRQRFTEILTAAGVRTINISIGGGLSARYGTTRGFAEEAAPSFRAQKVVREIVRRLQTDTDGPVFVAAHILDPHAPYEGSPNASPQERYLEEVAAVDRSLRFLAGKLDAMGLAPRLVWIVTADHGEALGEHDTFGHAATLYEELVRIPLIIRAPGLASRRVGARVTLLDVGPTVLDVFGVPTPGYFMGESLWSLARGQEPVPTRPIGLDAGRRIQGLVFPDGYKAIIDLHRGLEELYDLNRDPRELRNIVDDDPSAEVRLALVRRFFEVHGRADAVPYRP